MGCSDAVSEVHGSIANVSADHPIGAIARFTFLGFRWFV